MNKIKLIDLLNKIANGEEVPKKIKYEESIYTYWFGIQDYSETGMPNYLFKNMFSMRNYDLNAEVEIIEEDKKIEHIGIPVIDGDNTCNELMKSINVITEDISNKINEIIDYINKKRSKD